MQSLYLRVLSDIDSVNFDSKTASASDLPSETRKIEQDAKVGKQSQDLESFDLQKEFPTKDNLQEGVESDDSFSASQELVETNSTPPKPRKVQISNKTETVEIEYNNNSEDVSEDIPITSTEENGQSHSPVLGTLMSKDSP